jgi:ribose transport system permease protein
MFTVYAANHPAGLRANVAETAANKGVLLAFVAMAQAFVVLMAGIDLSVGMVFILANCVGRYMLARSAVQVRFGVIAVVFGLALPLRPFARTNPDFAEGLADASTGKVFGQFPASPAVLLFVVLTVWVPFRRSMLGRTVYAVGSPRCAA